jgi:putative CocE/NonD family hydrolase
MATHSTRPSPVLQALRFVLACLGGDRSRRRWLANWLELPPPRFPVIVKRKQPIPMRDGRVLLADSYIPKTRETCPTILIRSPWGRGWDKPPFSLVYMFLAQRFAEQGYHVVVQSTGALSFETNLSPASEMPDSQDTLTWLAEQPWFNGTLGMWGPSILGSILWSIATDAPASLKALVPSITTANWRDLYYEGDVFHLADVLMLLNMLSSVQPRHWRKSAPKAEAQRKKGLQAAFLQLPVREADVVALGRALPGAYRAILDHPQADDPFWHGTNHRSALKQIATPTHLVGGWHDIFLRALLTDYATLKEGQHTPYLTIGPWGHMAPAVGWESSRQALAWFDAHLKDRSQRLRPLPVRLYVMGSNGWREFPNWPPRDQMDERSYYLHAKGRLSQEAPATNTDDVVDQYRYDPANPTPSVGGPLLDPGLVGPRDNRVLEARPDVLCYTTPVLEHPVMVVGIGQLVLYVHSTAPWTDFVGRVCDVSPDGRSMNVCDGLVRLQPGEEKNPAKKDRSRRIAIELWPTAYTFLAGHRIRLQVASAAHPRWNRHLGTGEPTADATKMIAATQTLYHDVSHPSVLTLPVERIPS